MTKDSIKFMAMAVCVALSFVSCRNDNDLEDSGLVFLTPEFQSAAMIQTRALASGDYTSYVPTSGDRIQAFTYDEGHSEKYSAIRNGYFTYTTNWNSTVGCENNHSIDIYSIMPADIAAATMTSNGQVQLDGLNILSDKDILYSTAAAKTYGELSTGSFRLNNVRLTANPEDKVWFAMDHLFAKANLKFIGDEDYLNLRTVEITKVTVFTENGKCEGSSIKFGNPTTVTFGSTYSTCRIEKDMELPQAQVESRGVELTTEEQDFGSFHFLPQTGIPVSVTVCYNVYDKEGNLTRENQSATAGRLITLDRPEPGKEYNIRVNVKPTYLYVLTNNDAQLDLTIQ